MPNITRDDRRKDKWMVRWRETDDAGDHQRKKRGFSTKKEAEAWFYSYQKSVEARNAEEEASRKAEEARKDDPGNMLFEELAEEWLAHQKTRIKESSYIQDSVIVRTHLITAFGLRRLNQILPIDILHLSESKSRDLSFLYWKRIFNCLSAIFRYGEKYYNVVNIMNKVDRPRNNGPKRQMSFWTPEQFDKFIVQVGNPDYALFFRLLYLLGCRRGELQALQWRDLDFEECRVHLCHTITRMTETGTWKMTDPKTFGSDRYVRISERQMDMLRDRYAGHTHEPEAFVFGGNRPWTDNTINRVFHAASDKAGLPRIRVHDLRHSCASYLISQGIDIVTVSRRLGHSSVTQTLNTYSHMMKSAEDRSVGLLDQIV